MLSHFAADAPENPPENLQKLTVRDLLTMAPGQDAAYLMGGDREKLAERTDDFVRFCLAQPFPYAPGTHFKYNNMGRTSQVCLCSARRGAAWWTT